VTTLTIDRRQSALGAETTGVDVSRLLEDPDIPHAVPAAPEAHGVPVFPGLRIDDAGQVAFSRRLGRVEVLGPGETPEIFRVTVDPRKNPAAAYLRGTFDWHIDGCTDDVPIMATILSAHAVADAGGHTEFASSYAAFDQLTEEERSSPLWLRVVHTFGAAQRLVNDRPSPEELALWRARPPKVHPPVWTTRHGDEAIT